MGVFSHKRKASKFVMPPERAVRRCDGKVSTFTGMAKPTESGRRRAIVLRILKIRWIHQGNPQKSPRGRLRQGRVRVLSRELA